MKICEIKDSIKKHFNSDINTAKVLSCIVSFIKKGQEQDQKNEDERQTEIEELKRKRLFLDTFWKIHREDFLANGFRDEPYRDHPLMMAYNEINIELHYFREGITQNPNVITQHRYKDYESTGPLPIHQISDYTELTEKDVKSSINKLESLQILAKGKKGLSSAYWYYLEDESYLA